MKTLAHIGFLLLLAGPLKVPDFSHTDSIFVEYQWNGLSELAIISAKSTLQLKDNIWMGQSIISICSDSLRTSTNVSIPKYVVDSLIKELTPISLSQEEYKAKFTHTDDYPMKKLTFYLMDDSIDFFTYSQGKHNTPWQVSFSGQSNVSNSKDASKVFSKFWEHCEFKKIDSLKKLMHVEEK